MLKQRKFTGLLFGPMLFSLTLIVGLLVFTPSLARAAAGASCETTVDGIKYNGTETDKGECVYFITNSNELGNRPGQPGVNFCGDVNRNAIVTSINLGCKGKGNAVLDLLFAVIRFMTLGVSLVIIASMIVAGLQFTASRGDPQATAASLKRMASNASALLLFIFAYAILNWIVPNTILQ